MLSKPALTSLITIALFTISNLNALGQEAEPLSLILEVGAEYDNNITVDALDLTSQQGDSSALFEGEIAYDFISNGESSFKARYNFSQSLHLDLSEFDLQTHAATLEASTSIQDIDLGISYSFYNIRLGSEDFLQMHIIRPSFTMMLNQKVLFIGAYEYLQQNFQQDDLRIRNSKRHSTDVKTYFLLGSGRTINLGYKISSNDALAPQLDYLGHIVTLGFKLPVEAIEGAKFIARYRYNQKNYANITQVIGEKRKDKRHSVRVALQAPFMGQFTARVQYEYTDSTSNLQTLIYSNNVISFNIEWAF